MGNFTGILNQRIYFMNNYHENRAFHQLWVNMYLLCSHSVGPYPLELIRVFLQAKNDNSFCTLSYYTVFDNKIESKNVLISRIRNFTLNHDVKVA